MRHLLNDTAYIAPALDEHLEKSLVRDDADNVIETLLVNRQTRIHLTAEKLLYLVDRGIHLNTDDLDTRDKYLVDGYVIEFEGTFDEFTLLFLDNALFLDLIDHIFELVLGNAGSLIAPVKNRGELIEQKHKRFENGYEEGQRTGERKRYFFGISLGVGLRNDLTECQYEQRYHDSGYSRTVTAEYAYKQQGADGRSRDVHDIVSDEDRSQHLVKTVCEPERLCSFFAALSLIVLEAQLVYARKSSLRSRKQCGEYHHRDDENDFP